MSCSTFASHSRHEYLVIKTTDLSLLYVFILSHVGKVCLRSKKQLFIVQTRVRLSLEDKSGTIERAPDTVQSSSALERTPGRHWAGVSCVMAGNREVPG